jgi:Lrp/AsnC family transcriptional regulator, leucine-responsive regulatory protein
MIDKIDLQLLEILQRNARTSLKNLGEQTGLSSPTVSERLHRLEERGVIKAFTVELEPQALGYSIQAIVRVRPLPGHQREVQHLIETTPECTECDKVTGDDCYVLRVFANSMGHLDQIVERLANQAQTHTALVKSQLIQRRSPPLQIPR